MEIRGIKYMAPFMDGSGYAEASRQYIKALHSLGVPLTLEQISFEPLRPGLGETGRLLAELTDKDIEYNIKIMHLTPEHYPQYKERGMFNVGYSIWETSRLHPSWPEHINNNVQLAFVGCDWNVETYKKSGVTVPLVKIPHGINVADFDEVDDFELGGVDEKDYVFYSIFQWCYDDQTRVLTRDGFKYFKDLSYEDEIATLNLSNEELEYQKPEKIVRFKRDDKMLSLKGDFFDVCVTPDHKMVVKDGPKGDWELVPFNELITKGKSGQDIIPYKYKTKKNCKWSQGKEKEIFELPLLTNTKYPLRKSISTQIPMDAFLEFLGWYLSEGSTYKAKRGYVNTITQRNEKYRPEITSCIRRLGFNPFDKGKDIIFHSREMHHYLEQFGKAPDKFIPKWVKNLSSRQIEIMLQSLFKGDGSLYENGDWVKYTTTSKQLAEDVQECLLKIGMSGSISISDPSSKKPGKIDGRYINGKLLQYTVSVNRQRNEPTMYHSKLETIDYNGYVYCATVPNHAMLVERNGKVIFSGNTERKHPLALIKAYWSEFRRNEKVVLVMKTYRSDYSEREKNAIRDTIKKMKAIMPFDDYPKIQLITDILSRDELLGLHKRGDCFVLFQRSEGFGLPHFEAGACGNPIITTGMGGNMEFTKPELSYLVDYTWTPVFGMPWCMSLDSLVKTEYGYLQAKELKQDMYVINKNLNYKAINKIEFRPLLDDEDVYAIKCFSFPEEMKLTNDHKLYVIKNGEPIKCKVSEINVGDYLYVPQPKLHQDTPHFVKNKANTREKLEGLFYVFGLYLAEGYIDKGNYYVSFSFNINEKDTLAEKCRTIMKDIFEDDITHIYNRDLEDRNGYELSFFGPKIVEIFNNYFGTGSHEKFIDDKIKYNELNYELLRGYWDGDGHIRKQGFQSRKTGKRRLSPECVADTASFDLAMDMRDILLSLGIVPSIYKGIRPDGRISYTISVCSERFDHIFDIEARRVDSKYKIYLNSGGFGALITKKELIEDYDDLICTISVDPDKDEIDGTGGSYILNGIASSNCPWYRGDQWWAEPDIKHGAEQMRYVFEHQEEAREKGKQLQNYIKDNFTWEKVAQMMIDAIRSM